MQLPRPRHRNLSDFRVGVILDDPAAPVSSAVGEVLADAVDALATAGMTIVDALPQFDLAVSHRHYLQLFYGQEASNFPRSLRADYDDAFEDLGDADASRRAMVIRGVSQRHRHWLAINERRQRLRAAWADWFSQVDLLLCPITVVPAYPHDHSPLGSRTLRVDGVRRDYWEALFWAGLATLALLPATVLPAGISRDGLPVGLQAIGPYLEDLTPIAFARAAAEVIGGARRPPGF